MRSYCWGLLWALFFFLTGCDPLSVDRDPPAQEAVCDDGSEPVTWYFDGDGDSYGLDVTTQSACTQPDGYAAQGGDCMDDAASVHPGVNELCNSVDDDCDGQVDDSTSNVWYLDYDGDTYGDPAYAYTDGCDGSNFLVDNGEDCDDQNAEVNPAATEVCNDVDDDCDGTTDVDATDATAWFADEDGDGYGDADDSQADCDQPSGYVADDTDCDDANPLVNPGEVEICDEIDNDCDRDTDEYVTTEFFADTDGDGYGDPDEQTQACTAPPGYVSDWTDCDDGDSAIRPDAEEVCNDIDDNCDGDTDPDSSTDASTWYDDSDSDSYGGASPIVSCDMPEGAVEDDTDCDDTDASVNPGEAEVCNDVDDDCDGAVDPSTSTDAGTWYVDSDGDSYGDTSASFVSCDSPAGYVSDSTDCDDGDSSSYPGATEVCDGADNDCDGSTDPDSSTDASTWYSDVDGDGYGDASSSSVSCEAPLGSVADSSDCDDTDSSVNPGATEVCNETDDDCDGDVDEEVTSTFYADADGDGYGDASSSTEACSAPPAFVENDNDCDDNDASVYPGAMEYCDGADNDCDGDIDPDSSYDAGLWYIDEDGDEYGVSDVSTDVESCEEPSGYSGNDLDCDDGDELVNPSMGEDVYIACVDTLDNDCDGYVDSDDEECYTDGDLDSFTPMYGDCDDGDELSYPDAEDVCDDGIDQDCDGEDLECPPESDTGDTAAP